MTAVTPAIAQALEKTALDAASRWGLKSTIATTLITAMALPAAQKGVEVASHAVSYPFRRHQEKRIKSDLEKRMDALERQVTQLAKPALAKPTNPTAKTRITKSKALSV